MHAHLNGLRNHYARRVASAFKAPARRTEKSVTQENMFGQIPTTEAREIYLRVFHSS